MTFKFGDDNMRICIAFLALFCAASCAAEADSAALVTVTRIYTGADDLTHFAEGAVALEMKDFSPPTPTVAVSTPLPASSLAFVSLPAGWFGDWHPAPQRQFVLMLNGTFEIETGDGESRRISAGSVLLVEDTHGQGHRTRVVSEQAVQVAIVPSSSP
jgi:quercetin dioxygenase-like cupin family protein